MVLPHKTELADYSAWYGDRASIIYDLNGLVKDKCLQTKKKN